MAAHAVSGHALPANIERMAGVKRLSDWPSLSQNERTAAAAACRRRTGTLGVHLNAVAAILPEPETRSGPLAGLPYVVKDMFATGVHKPSHGLGTSPSTGGQRAEILLRLDRAGASLIAAAEMTTLAYEPSGHNAERGRVLNPWDLEAVTGGSSSGSAALVAAGCAFAALGSDTGGSVRIPAACCSVTSLKPTHGAIPEAGAMTLSPSLDTVGLLARSATDLALLWPVVSGGTYPPANVSRAVRLADFFEQSAPEIRTVCDAAIVTLASLGVRIANASGFPKRADEHAMTVMQGEAARIHRDLGNIRDALLRKRMQKGLDISATTIDECLAERDRLRDEFLDTLGGADVALTPVMPIAVPDAAETDPASDQFRPQTLYRLSNFTRFVNYLGLPAMSVPVGFDGNGRPVGLQIVGQPQQDAQLLALAALFQGRTDWHGRVPTAVAETTANEGEAAA
ncbi:MAG: amidase [Alphaproteobacteria bacterium]|nr:amidase [Alphaproteobacteria bacterium]